MAVSSLPMTMNTRDEQFFKEHGARVAQARKDHGLTQQDLAEQLGVAQQQFVSQMLDTVLAQTVGR
jgi:ribosome-binding protein aMBF1 (putative translation factor)